ncbi:MAG: glutamine amidotransferase [Planctomycetota bacterium]
MAGPAPILYLGDTALRGAASYLAGVLHHNGLAFDYGPSDEPIGAGLLADQRRLVILSDYPAAMLPAPEQDELIAAIHAGCGLVMLGGWESYHGQGGDWQDTPVANALPVAISPRDDRVNFDQAALLRPAANHPILANLPWAERPPAVGGYNRFEAKPNGTTVLDVVRQQIQRDGDGFRVNPAMIDPMLVVGKQGKGRVACLATDAAPHWVGPLVDWGTDNNPPSGNGRVTCHAPDANPVEVGACYAQFFIQLMKWCASL